MEVDRIRLTGLPRKTWWDDARDGAKDDMKSFGLPDRMYSSGQKGEGKSRATG